MKKILLTIAITLCIFQMVVLATAIDIGTEAIGRASYYSSGSTFVAVENPANVSGTITSVEIWAVSGNDLEDCEVATFYVVSGNNLSTRDTHTIGDVTAGSKQTFSGLDITVEAGDYLGITYTGGRLELDTSGSGVWTKIGDQIPCTNIEFSLTANRTISLYGTGETPPSGITWNGVTITKLNGVTITKINGK